MWIHLGLRCPRISGAGGDRDVWAGVGV